MSWKDGFRSTVRASVWALAVGITPACVNVAAAAGDFDAAMAKPSNGVDPIKAFSDGVVALDQGRFETAVAKLAEAARGSPATPDVWRFLGTARAGIKDWSGSRTAYEQALKLSPLDVGSHAGLAVALFALGDPRASAEADWMEEKVKACNAKCDDASYLVAMTDQVRSAANGKFAPVL